MSDWGEPGTIYKSGSGELFSAGNKSRIFWVSLLASGTTGVVKLRNNGKSGNIYVQLNAPAAVVKGALNGTEFDLGVGVEFPDGCYVDFGAKTAVSGGIASGVTSATIVGRKEHIVK